LVIGMKYVAPIVILFIDPQFKVQNLIQTLLPISMQENAQLTLYIQTNLSITFGRIRDPLY